MIINPVIGYHYFLPARSYLPSHNTSSLLGQSSLLTSIVLCSQNLRIMVPCRFCHLPNYESQHTHRNIYIQTTNIKRDNNEWEKTAQMILHAKITCRVTLLQVLLQGYCTKFNVTHLQLQLVQSSSKDAFSSSMFTCQQNAMYNRLSAITATQLPTYMRP